MRRDWLRRFDTAARTWDAVESAMLALLVCGMVFVEVLQIVLRNFFRSGLLWADSTLGMSLLWLTLLGGLAATSSRRHINMDLLSPFLPPRGRAILRILLSLFAAGVCAILTRAAFEFVGIQKEMGDTLPMGIPVWKCEAIMPVGFALISLRFLGQAVYSLVEAAGPALPPGEEAVP